MDVSDGALARIVHPTDFEAGGEAAFQHALRLGLAARGQLRLIHVDPDRTRPGPEWRSFPGVRRTLGRWGLLEEDAPESAVADRLGLFVSKHDLGAPAPVKAVIRFLQDHPSDLIVLGAHARDGLDRILQPSVSEPLARHARIPALFTPTGGRGFVDGETGSLHLRNVLIPVDLAPDPEPAIGLAVALSDLLGEETRFHLLHVGVEAAPVAGFADDGRMHRLTRQGPVVETIVETAHKVGADLIVMATNGHDGFLDVFRGSTTEQVLRRSGRALLAVPI